MRMQAETRVSVDAWVCRCLCESVCGQWSFGRDQYHINIVEWRGGDGKKGRGGSAK